MIKHLRELAHDGRTIICVIHQPSSSLFQLFDDLYILSNGNCIFNSSLESMVDTFKQAGFNCPSYYNRADYALEVASLQEVGGNIDQLIAGSRRYGATTPPPINLLPNATVDSEQEALLAAASHQTQSDVSSTDSQVTVALPMIEGPNYPISTWRQVLVLTQRSTICTLRDLVSLGKTS